MNKNYVLDDHSSNFNQKKFNHSNCIQGSNNLGDKANNDKITKDKNDIDIHESYINSQSMHQYKPNHLNEPTSSKTNVKTSFQKFNQQTSNSNFNVNAPVFVPKILHENRNFSISENGSKNRELPSPRDLLNSDMKKKKSYSVNYYGNGYSANGIHDQNKHTKFSNKKYQPSMRNNYNSNNYEKFEHNYSYSNFRNIPTRKSYNNQRDSWKSNYGGSRRYDVPGKLQQQVKNDVQCNFKQNKNLGKFSLENKVENILNNKTQRETMIDCLSKGTYECMVCCDKIKEKHTIWSCEQCFNCFHLNCITQWATSSKNEKEKGWRCPACQNLNAKSPAVYYCYCKKIRDPVWNRRDIPHSCGELCGKKRGKEWCNHKCNLLCHPGPCPECSAYIKRNCQCGKSSIDVRCSSNDPVLCKKYCDKFLNCTVHTCKQSCHVGACESCAYKKKLKCFCEKESKEITCTYDIAHLSSFSCDSICNHLLNCKNHTCEKKCHKNECEPCKFTTDLITTCPCGKMNLTDLNYVNSEVNERTSCLDPIPLCGKPCGKILTCGLATNPHICISLCHEGPCPPCTLTTEVLCRCGTVLKKILCSELSSKSDVLCDKQCKRLRQCGRHKCGTKCCIDIDHLCDKLCNKFLDCRKHRCQETCHRGKCSRCWETSFDDLTCDCGSSILPAPIACGTKPPLCEKPCSRIHTCNHPVTHNCHTDTECPPCITLTGKPCFGKHTVMRSTPCYLSGLSCGSLCNKELECKIHKCLKVCHEGSCGKKCNQKCTRKKANCEHLCGFACHKGPCPSSPCDHLVTVTCMCENLKLQLKCAVNDREYKATLGARTLVSNGSLSLTELMDERKKFKRLDCTSSCSHETRKRQMALALQIENFQDDRLSLKGDHFIGFFTESLKLDAKKDLDFADFIHLTLADLVMKVKSSKHQNRSHSFLPMNSPKRKFIHEYCKYFGCESQAYDEEPKKNVVVTGYKNTCCLPPISIIEAVKREQLGATRKMPPPVSTKKLNCKEEMGQNGMHKLGKTCSSKEKFDDNQSKKS